LRGSLGGRNESVEAVARDISVQMDMS
jgi:hypothetical protein